VRPVGEEALAAGRRVLARCDLVRLNDRVLDRAGEMAPDTLRSLDAIHLATAERLGSDLGGLVTYDDRLAHAARRLGLRVSSPA
jgi:predicted nucleic acid-binding protein